MLKNINRLCLFFQNTKRGHMRIRLTHRYSIDQISFDGLVEGLWSAWHPANVCRRVCGACRHEGLRLISSRLCGFCGDPGAGRLGRHC